MKLSHPHEFFCRVAGESQTCTVRRMEGGGGAIVAVARGAAAWCVASSPKGGGNFCLAVEGGEPWSAVGAWGSIFLGEATEAGVTLSDGTDSVFLKGLPWVVGADVPEAFRVGTGVARWIFDSEANGDVGGDAPGGVAFGDRKAVLRGVGGEVRGTLVSSPFDFSFSLGELEAEVVAQLVGGGGRFTADLHAGKLGPLVVRGARGGVAVTARFG